MLKQIKKKPSESKPASVNKSKIIKVEKAAPGPTAKTTSDNKKKAALTSNKKAIAGQPIIKDSPQRGRKPTGKALSSTERGKVHDEALRAAGGRILSRVRLDADAAKALDIVREKLGSDRFSIEESLKAYAKKMSRSS